MSSVKAFQRGLACLFFLCGILSQAQSFQGDQLLDQWHAHATKGELTPYFELMSSDFHFVGTQADEVWNKTEFYNYSQPVFAKGSGWKMEKIQRNWYGDFNSELVYFEEIVQSSMGLCRGSGVFKKVDGQWKIAHYVLSITIANEHVKQVHRLNESHYQSIQNQLKK